MPLLAKGLTWKRTSRDHPAPPPKRKRKGIRSGDTVAEGDGQEDALAGRAAQMSDLLETPIDDVNIIGNLGYGHN